MTPSYHRVQELFLRARELEGDARASYLQEECGADEALLDLGVLQEVGDRKRGRVYRYYGLAEQLREHLPQNTAGA